MMLKNWKTILTIITLLKSLNQHTVRKCKYARNIWTYLTEFYKQSDQTAQMIVLKKLIIWKMNLNHTIKKADQEISFIADWVHQIKEKVQSSRLVKVLFLNSLLKQYENFCQLLKFHVKILDQIIESLSAAEACMKGENENLYGMNIATKSARRFKIKWMKIAMCYNCGKIGHISRFCKKLKKKNHKNNDQDNENNNKKIKNKTNKKLEKSDN